ncbi:MAG: aminotransferase class V-fold PLP-dependent enzyme [Candidatus Riflebacteria bacterium]|nr:aminotransferase class V-fold PLP-dependent enzyme [Candidatus Riflebacteria bacterium]
MLKLLRLLFNPGAYLDHNASTPVHELVQRQMNNILQNVYGNASSLHTQGRISRGHIEESRKTIASILKCNPENIYFTSGGTEANNTALKGTFFKKTGKHLITGKIEHESILGAAGQIEEMGHSVTYLPATSYGRVNPEEIAANIRAETCLISIMHANNETGIIQPVREISEIARSRNIPLHIDAVQSFGKIPVHVNELGCDFLTVSSHKIQGPKGCGLLYSSGRYSWTPLIFGGEQEQLLRAGTEGIHQIAGFALASSIAEKNRQKTFQKLCRLRKVIKYGCRLLFPKLIINESQERWQLPGTLNLTFPEISGIRLLAGLDCYGVSVSIGSACTANRIEPSHVLLGMGISEELALSSIRVSMGPSTDIIDVLFFLWALNQVLKGDPEGFSFIDPEHLTESRILSNSTYLIDLRLPHERFFSPSIPGAQNLSHIGFEKYIPGIPLDKEVVLMCSTGIFSLGAGYRLAKSGHRNVKVLFGGYSAWQGRYPELLQKLIQKPTASHP